MRRTSIVRDSTFVAIALGLAVFSTSTTPASALSLTQINMPRNAELNQHAPVTNGGTLASNQFPNKGGMPVKPQLPQPTNNQAPINQIINSGPLKPIGPVANSGNPQAPVKPPFHICPMDRPCPPLPTPNGNGANTGNNGTNTGSNGNGSGTNVSINLPPIVIGRQAPVYAAPQPVFIQRPQYPTAMQAQMPNVARPSMPQSQPMAQAPVTQVNTAAAQPTNCLTKQYLSDGSALFSDICTGETAMATQAQLQAEAQARAGQPVAQPQVSSN